MKCPKCNCERFIAPAIVIQSWEVDGTGDFIKVVNDCDDVFQRPTKADSWNCAECGEEIECD
jgi:hypothetical protein